MKTLFYYLILAIVCSSVTSCQNDITKSITPTLVKPTVVDGMLYFPSKESYTDWVMKLSKVSVEEQSKWADSFNFTPLIHVVDKRSSLPDIYKYLLNSNKQVRVGDVITRFDGITVTKIPHDDDHLLTLLKSDPDSDELQTYRKTAIRKIDALNSEVSTPTDPNARQNLTYRDIKYYYIGSIGGTGNFRFDFRIEETCDGNGGAYMSYYNRIEYQSPRNGGWYQENYAQVDGRFDVAFWAYRVNPTNVARGTTPLSYFNGYPNSGDGSIGKVMTMGGVYPDFGYTPPFRVEMDFSMRPYYNGAYGTTWAGHAVFTNTSENL